MSSDTPNSSGARIDFMRRGAGEGLEVGSWVEGLRLTILGDVVFEGPGHPYRKNIVKLHDVPEQGTGERTTTSKILDAVKEREKGSRVVMAGQQ